MKAQPTRPIRIDAEVHRAVKHMATDLNIPMGELLEMAINQYVATLEGKKK